MISMDVIRVVSALLFGSILVTQTSHTDSRTILSDPTDFSRDPLSSSTVVAATSVTDEHDNVIYPNREEVIREQAMEKLFQVFGLENNTAAANEVGGGMTGGGFEQRPRPRIPPYMLNLYNSVADSTSGITRTPNPYYANTVRAFQDKDLSQDRMRFEFNVTRVSPDESLLQAELHLFKLKPKRYSRNDPRAQAHYQVHLYQLLGDADSSPEGAKLIGLRLISAARSGWEVFSISEAVQTWLADESTNHGILISVTSLTGEPIEDGLIRFAQRGKHHDTKQPLLVLFTDDVTRKTSPKTRFEETPDYTYDEIRENYGNVDMRQFNSASVYAKTYDDMSTEEETTRHHSVRNRREAEHTIPAVVASAKPSPKELCQRQSMYVDFEKIGWSSWVISPKGYNAYHCTGTCPFPLGFSQQPSNHATIQSIMNALNLGEDVGRPCCVPNALYAVSLLYFDNDGNVVLKQYADMVAASCGCH